MDPKAYLQGKKERLEKALAEYLSASDNQVYQAMRYTVLSGGKRFRPLLFLSCGDYFGATEEFLIPYACAIELIHNYSLVHDDLPAMDNDDFRRGQPTCHRKFGEALAILAGDALLTLAFQIMAEAPAPEKNPAEKDVFIKELAEAIGPTGMVEGQWLDLSLSPENKNPEDYQNIASKKTAALIMAAASGGARLAGASPASIEAIKRYGYCLGLAFQLRDDLDDLDRDQKSTSGYRPNLAALLGKKQAASRLSGLQSAAAEALRTCGIQSSVLEYFIWMLNPQPEKLP